MRPDDFQTVSSLSACGVIPLYQYSILYLNHKHNRHEKQMQQNATHQELQKPQDTTQPQ